MTTNEINFINALKQIRKQKHLSQSQLANICKIPQSTIGRIEAYKLSPSLKTACKLCDALDVSLDFSFLNRDLEANKSRVIVPKKYNSYLDVYETQSAIEFIKKEFQREFETKLNLRRVSAPLFVLPSTGMNDNLSGKEHAVSFAIPSIDYKKAEVVHSLAKWKRMALYEYGFHMHEGLYTDMNAIRKDELLDNIHSIYVDQWDWEKIINDNDRNEKYLQDTVREIVKIIVKIAENTRKTYQKLTISLCPDVYFITADALLKMYPNKTSKEREYLISKKYKTVFISQIGKKLSDGSKHDSRSPDYDDWELNGDIIFYNEFLDIPFEVSSMGIRVNKKSLIKQLKESNTMDRINYEYHQNVINDVYPLTIGGGIGQSRLCQLILQKAHIGEVQSSVWDEQTKRVCAKNNIKLL